MYVNDFILLQQGLPSQQLAARRNLFHYIDRVFCPNNQHDTTRREVNSHSNISINTLELAAHVLQFLLKTPYMDPLKHILDGVNSTAAQLERARQHIAR